MTPQVKFKNYTCDLEFNRYAADGSPHISLIDIESKEFIATATVYIQGKPPAENYVWIKDYSENEGILQALIDAKVVEPTGIHTTTGFVTVPLVRLLISPKGEKL